MAANHDRDDEREQDRTGVPTPESVRPGPLQQRRTLVIAAGAAGVAVLAAVLWYAMTPAAPKSESGPVPDFAAIDHIPERKQAFFEFLEPMIEARNEWILDNRDFLRSVQADLQADRSLKGRDQERVEALATRYGVELDDGITPEVIDELLYRGDVIPPSLVLAQAAKESGWGMSRFAREGNNYFGEWCYTEGCGLVPGRRGAGQKHEVEFFETVEDGVDSYFRNLNRAGPYEQVRALRAESREQGGAFDSKRLAGGLQKYSERGQAYVEEVRSLISYNKLTEYDTELASVTADAGSRDSG